MSNINKIKVSGQTYNIEDENATKTVELTQAQYDALTVKDPNTFYVITDAQGADLSNYYTKSETSGATEISTALNAKQDTLVSGTNIKTINNESILGSGNIEIEGGSDINVVQTTGTSTTDVMSQDAVTTQLDNKANSSAAVGGYQFGATSNVGNIRLNAVGSGYIGSAIYYPTINGKGILTSNLTWAKNNYNFQLVETSAITTSVTSSSTDAQVPSAKAVNDKLGGLSIVKLTESEYAALVTKDSNTLYCVVPDPSN